MNIEGKKLILIGEFHGTKETPIFLKEWIEDLAKTRNIMLCLEIPADEQEYLVRSKASGIFNIPFFFSGVHDGRDSAQYLDLIKELADKVDIRFICPGVTEKRDELMAENILAALSNDLTVAILGNVHAAKKPMTFGAQKIITAGSILNEKLGDQMTSISLWPRRGTMYNGTIKEIPAYDDSYAEFHDEMYFISEATPCTFITR